MSSATRSRLAVWMIVCLCMSRSMATVAAQNSTETQQDEIQAVFRISKAFLAEVTDRPIVADIPLCATMLNLNATA